MLGHLQLLSMSSTQHPVSSTDEHQPASSTSFSQLSTGIIAVQYHDTTCSTMHASGRVPEHIDDSFQRPKGLPGPWWCTQHPQEPHTASQEVLDRLQHHVDSLTDDEYGTALAFGDGTTDACMVLHRWKFAAPRCTLR